MIMTSRRRFLTYAVAAVPVAALGAPAVASATTAAGELPPYVGAAAGAEPPYDFGAVWDQAERDLGRLTYRRCFDSTTPEVGNENWRLADAPNNFYSVKPPNNDFRGIAEGKYDERLAAVVRALPRGTKFTMYHEPEDNMSGEDFFHMYERVHTIFKAERPDPSDVELWYVAMAYQWRTNSKGNVGTNEGWVDAAKLVDGVSLDVYASPWYFTKLADDEGLHRWWELIKEPSGKKWGISERGITADNGEEARLEMLEEDWEFVNDRCADIYLYWQSPRDGTWPLTTKAELQLYRSYTRMGRR